MKACDVELIVLVRYTLDSYVVYMDMMGLWEDRVGWSTAKAHFTLYIIFFLYP